MRALALVAFLVGAALAGGVEVAGELRFGLGVRVGDLAVSESGVELLLSLGYSREGSGLGAELLADREGVSLGEAYLRAELASVELVAGRIRAGTGREGLYSPLDLFAPRDLSQPLLAEREPVAALEVGYRAEAGSVRVLYAPVFVPSTPPRDPPLPAGVVRVETARPAEALGNGVVGLRAEGELEGVELGAALVYTYTPFPSLKALLDASDPSRPCPDPEVGPCVAVLGYDRLLVVGGDWSLRVPAPWGGGPLVVGGEVAYGADQSSYLEGTLGLGGGLGEAEAALRYHLRWRGEWVHHLLLTAGYRVEGGLSLEGVWAQNLGDGSGGLRAGARYRLGEGLEAYGELVLTYGDPESEFGAWGGEAGVRLGLGYSF